MLFSEIFKLGTFFKKKSMETRILLLYRLISLLITSIFYILYNPDHEISRKIIIIGCLSISSVILSYLYPAYENSKKNIKLLIIIETIGNTILLIPSGGIKSSFIWYSLNTILISIIFLSRKYCWYNFLLYLLCFGIINKYFTNNTIDIINILKDESNLLLSFIMIIFAIQILTLLMEKIKEESTKIEKINTQLEETNRILHESIDTIQELYQSASILTSQGNSEGIIKLSFEHIKSITKNNIVFYYDKINNKYINSENNTLFNDIEEYITSNIGDLINYNDFIEFKISNYNIVIVQVGNNYNLYGLLGMVTSDDKNCITYKNNIYQLNYLSNIISNSFERLNLEEVNERLLITEEQNRIANEIHDSVLQRLFSISCGMFTLIKNIDNSTTENIEKELNSFRIDIDITMKDLRNKIYGLSWKKSGVSSFNLDIKRYIDDIKKYNQVNIPLNIIGNIELLSTEQKRALYRIICEGIGNAVRHGKAKNIEVTLEIKPKSTNLTIIDDGLGFNLNMEINKPKGLGLQNMKQLTEILLGEISINSETNIGTKVFIKLPNFMIKGEAEI